MMDLDPAFGNWLAGFIDGEGCFHIADKTQTKNGRSYRSITPVFMIACRLDDGAIIREIHRQIGVGNVYVITKEYDNFGKSQLTKPQIKWQIQGARSCLKLVEVLTRYPLRAKKARDFEIWRMAVAEHAGRKDRDAMIAYCAALKDIKRYNAETVDLELAPITQLRLVDGQ